MELALIIRPRGELFWNMPCSFSACVLSMASESKLRCSYVYLHHVKKKTKNIYCFLNHFLLNSVPSVEYNFLGRFSLGIFMVFCCVWGGGRGAGGGGGGLFCGIFGIKPYRDCPEVCFVVEGLNAYCSLANGWK